MSAQCWSGSDALNAQTNELTEAKIMELLMVKLLGKHFETGWYILKCLEYIHRDCLKPSETLGIPKMLYFVASRIGHSGQLLWVPTFKLFEHPKWPNHGLPWIVIGDFLHLTSIHSDLISFPKMLKTATWCTEGQSTWRIMDHAIALPMIWRPISMLMLVTQNQYPRYISLAWPVLVGMACLSTEVGATWVRRWNWDSHDCTPKLHWLEVRFQWMFAEKLSLGSKVTNLRFFWDTIVVASASTTEYSTTILVFKHLRTRSYMYWTLLGSWRLMFWDRSGRGIQAHSQETQWWWLLGNLGWRSSASNIKKRSIMEFLRKLVCPYNCLLSSIRHARKFIIIWWMNSGLFLTYWMSQKNLMFIFCWLYTDVSTVSWLYGFIHVSVIHWVG